MEAPRRREVAPHRVLEVGCGTGDFSERVQRELGTELVAIDLSRRMVALTRSRGLDAIEADIQSLPFADDGVQTPFSAAYRQSIFLAHAAQATP